MHEVLNKNLFLVKEHVGLFKAANNYDIYDPETDEMVMECREEKLGSFTKLLRFSDWKRMTPFDIEIRTPDGTPLVRVKRGISVFLSKVQVYDGSLRLAHLCSSQDHWRGVFPYISGLQRLRKHL